MGEINLNAYFDLEAYDDELDTAISVRGVARIAKGLGVRPSDLYGGSSNGLVSTTTLAAMICTHLEQSGIPLSEFENCVGYAVAAALAAPAEFHAFNADGLRAVCAAVNVDWLSVLDCLECDEPTVASASSKC